MKKALEMLNEININEKIVIAVSGGPDSMALFDLVLKIIPHQNIICAHINHGLRKESLEEKKYVKNLCTEKKVIFEYLMLEKIEKGNFHHEARKLRYLFFEKICIKHQAKYLLTAHHADDFLEGIILRLTRGTELNGYIGINESEIRTNYTLLRPLLYNNKNEILEYCQNNNVKYFIDESNYSDKYKRNYIRNNIVPKVKKQNPNIMSDLIQASNKIKRIKMQFDKIALLAYSLVVVDNKININLINKLPTWLIKFIVRLWLLKSYEDNIVNITNKHITIILELIIKEGNRYNNLPMNKKVFRSYNEIYLVNGDAKIEKINIPLLNDKIKLQLGNIEKLSPSEASSYKIDNNITFISSEDLVLPLIVKNIDLNTEIILKNSLIRKKINRIMIDEKISRYERDKKIIIVDQNNEVVWIPGLKKSKYDVYPNNKYDIILRYY